MAERMQETMPEVRDGWVPVDAGFHLVVLFHRNRPQVGQGGKIVEQPEIIRPTIVVGVPGRDYQVLRLDPFTVGGHYHVMPTQQDTPIPFMPRDGQTYLDAALEYFEEPDRFRELLGQTDQAQLAAKVVDDDLMRVARQIRQIVV